MISSSDCNNCEYHLVTIKKRDENYSKQGVYDKIFYCLLPDEKQPSGTIKFWKKYKELNNRKDWATDLPDAKKFNEKNVRKELNNRKEVSVDEWVEISRRLEKNKVIKNEKEIM